MEIERSARRIAIVTGASRRKGIGSAICRALGQAGLDIFFTHWDVFDKTMPWGAEEDEPAQLQHYLHTLGMRCEHLKVDLSQLDAPARILDAVEQRLGNPSVLVNNATHDDFQASFDLLDAPTLDKYYAVNMRGTILLSTDFARRFAFHTGGRIINLTSGQGLGAMPGKLPYVATKGAIDAVTVTLAKELAAHGITVNAVDPGPTDTGWMTDEIKQRLLPELPMGRVGQPEDAARLIAFLASEASEWVTGQIIRSRGGF